MNDDKLDRIVLLLEHMHHNISDLKEGQKQLKQQLEAEHTVLNQKLAAVAEAVSVNQIAMHKEFVALNNEFANVNQKLEKLDYLEKVSGSNSMDIAYLKAAK